MTRVGRKIACCMMMRGEKKNDSIIDIRNNFSYKNNMTVSRNRDFFECLNVSLDVTAIL